MRHAGSQEGTAWNLCLVRQYFTWFALSWFFRGVHAVCLIHDSAVTYVFDQMFEWATWLPFLLSYKLPGYILNAFWVLFPFFKCICVWDVEDTEQIQRITVWDYLEGLQMCYGKAKVRRNMQAFNWVGSWQLFLVHFSAYLSFCHDVGMEKWCLLD